MSILPEVFHQTEPKEDVSNKYELINTGSIVESLANRGFSIDSYQTAGFRVEANRDKQKHLVTMKYTDLETKEGVPTILIQNSHNRSSGLKLYTGYIRFACLNGLVAGTDVETTSIRHNGEWEPKLESFIDGYVNNVSKMESEHEKMKSKVLGSVSLRYLLEEAAKLRYDLSDIMDINELNITRRIEDKGKTGWEVYNRVQEALIKGHFTRRTIRDLDDGVTVDNWSKAKEIRDTSEIIRLNRSLRDIVMEVI